jgi:uncharacterized protein (UPF0261 family)/ABC-type branched-subunit amino acid transport system ATPase component
MIMSDRASAPILKVQDLNVYYGQSHALQGVDLTLGSGVLSVVGRNGMGKTTLCKAIMGLETAAAGSITFDGHSLAWMGPSEIARLGIGYVPQGRRLWKSLTVEEHLQLVARKGGPWTVERIYSVFPRLAERKNNGGSQLSGGEQQMLAIGRALLLNPKLLVMDEPTEGLAPVIVTHVANMLTRLGQEGDIDVLVIEQNIGVACSVSDQVAIMVNGRINRVMASDTLAADKDLQQALLGVGRHAHDETDAPVSVTDADSSAEPLNRVYQSNPQIPNRWSQAASIRQIEQSARTITPNTQPEASGPDPIERDARNGLVYICGTLDTKGDELQLMRDVIKAQGLRTALVDLSTSGQPSGADVPPSTIAAFHPRGASGVFTQDRGTAVSGMTIAFERWIRQRDDVAAVLSAAGSGGTAMVAPAFRALPLGVPKLILSTVASGQTQHYVGGSDMLLMNAVADIQGVNFITGQTLKNAAEALAGMAKARRLATPHVKQAPNVGMTIFGVTTPCVSQVSNLLKPDFEPIVFHATGDGGRSMETLLAQGALDGVIDLTTTEIADLVVGGVMAADDTRLDAFARQGGAYIGACGALDMVNFHGSETVPHAFSERIFYQHNPQVTLMRTSDKDCASIGAFIGEKLNTMNGPVRFFLNEGGLSTLDAEGQPFYAPSANAALFQALESTVHQTGQRKVIRVPHHINAPEFAQKVAETFRSLTGGAAKQRKV